MLKKIPLPKQIFQESPPVGFHFLVTFLTGGFVPNPLDIRFQRVSGISAEMNTENYEEGGQNLYTHRLPGRISYGNLVLERGYVSGTPLGVEFVATLENFAFFPSNVIVTLLSEKSIPVASWVFIRAYPVRWSISDLDANANQIVVETMELAYSRFKKLL